jgi:FKBP-type peptidyl-prolyl cis-trans isomerase SlyD
LDEFPEEICVEPGVELEMKDQDGDTLFAKILSVGKSRAKLDFNHPLAGKELTFDVKIVELRQPTAEELEHGHVHGSDGHVH